MTIQIKVKAGSVLQHIPMILEVVEEEKKIQEAAHFCMYEKLLYDSLIKARTRISSSWWKKIAGKSEIYKNFDISIQDAGFTLEDCSRSNYHAKKSMVSYPETFQSIFWEFWNHECMGFLFRPKLIQNYFDGVDARNEQVAKINSHLRKLAHACTHVSWDAEVLIPDDHPFFVFLLK